MIVDTEEELQSVLEYIKDKKTLLVPIYADHLLHPAVNKISCIYIYTEDGVERLVPFYHTEQLRGFSDHLPTFLNLPGIFVHDKKNWLVSGGNPDCLDVKTLWWFTYNEPYDESHYPTIAHNFYWRRHTKLPNVNTIIPIMKHVEMCQKIRYYAWPMILNMKMDEPLYYYNNLFPRIFAEIEKAGISVNEKFPLPNLIFEGRVYSQYHYHTATGRPSNAFGGFNYAAMNKEDGTRDSITNRNGALVEMDFDAYHLRIIANIIGHKFPEGSVHKYLGQFYFGTDTLTTDQYEESKKITFRLLYGGIDKEFLQIPFFNEVNDKIWTLFKQWQKRGYIETPLGKRKITMENVEGVTANKLFNYYLQAAETEISGTLIHEAQKYLKDFKSEIVLYTYDSFLIDCSLSEVNIIIPELERRLKYPVKIKYGNIYSKVRELVS